MEKKTARKRGQTSLEFLMTYGWVIIILSLVLIVLYQWGMFNAPAKTKPSYLGFWGVAVTDFIIRANGDIAVNFQNKIVEGDVNITNINVTHGTSTYLWNASTDPSTDPIPLVSGNNTAFVLDHDTSGFASGSGGESYSIFVAVDYYDVRLGPDQLFRSSGIVQGSREM